MPAAFIEDNIQPGEIKYPFAWLQFRPAKYCHRHHIAFCLLHHGNVFINNIGVILPLLRIIIRAMQQRTNLRM